MKKLEYTVIELDEHYFAYCEKMEHLVENGLIDENSIEHYKLISALIEIWDKKHANYTEMDPVKIVNYMMEQHQLKPKDLVEITKYGKFMFPKY